MSGLTVSRTVATVGLDPNAVLKQAWRLYKRLLTRSLLMGGVIFGTLHLLEAVARSGRSGLAIGLLTVVARTRGHRAPSGRPRGDRARAARDGDDDASAVDAIGRAGGKLLKLSGGGPASGLALWPASWCRCSSRASC